MKTLNYKYAIFPTTPQRRHLSTQMKESRFQWNRAVKTRKRLKGSLQCFKVAPVLREIFSIQKDNTQGLRAKAIARAHESFPDCDTRDLPTLYDLNKIFGKAFPIRSEHIDFECLADQLQPLLRKEMTDFRAYWRLPEKDRAKSPPKRIIYFRLLDAVRDYAGLEAQRFMNAAFQAKSTVSRSTVRFKISGGGKSNSRFEAACSPSPEQRKIGKCLTARNIVAVQTVSSRDLVLYMADSRMIRAQLNKACNARDFYLGFYIEPNDDGELCVDRDMLRSRNGASCKIGGIRQLVPTD